MENGKTLYLLDGYAALFRAFYAIRNPLYSPVTGEPTQAILVFAQMLLKLYTTLSPDYVVVAWDAPGKTFRDTLFAQYAEYAAQQANLVTPPTPPFLLPLPTAAEPAAQAKQAEAPAAAAEPAPPQPTVPADGVPPAADAPPIDAAPPVIVPSYKGTRRETPHSLHEQTARILELLELFNIPVIGKPGLEAVDIIATLTGRVLHDPDKSEVRVRIVSRDKDLEQLIGERVTLFDVHTGMETTQADLWQKRGITPAQVVDFLSLTGDAVDNIPGVPGIGPKTAAKLLQQFGTLDGVLNHVAAANDAPEVRSLSAGLRESLEQARPLLPVSRRMVALHHDADIPFVLEDARARPVSAIAADMVRFCEMLGFNNLKKQFLRNTAEESD